MLQITINNKQYRSFIKYAILTCDCFSLVFGKTDENKSQYVFQEIYNSISEHVINNKNVWCHPDTGSTFENSDITYFKCNKSTSNILQTAYSPFDWDGKSLPEELCFYRNGKKWFVCISHEKLLFMYNETKDDIDFLEKEKIKYLQ